MNSNGDYEEVYLKISGSIGETFSKLCAIWDVIGLVPSHNRNTTKINLMSSCVEAVDQHLAIIYETELKVFPINCILNRNNLNMKIGLRIWKIRL